MRKFLSWLLVLTMLLGALAFSSCGDEKSTEAQTNASTDAESKVADVTEAQGETEKQGEDSNSGETETTAEKESAKDTEADTNGKDSEESQKNEETTPKSNVAIRFTVASDVHVDVLDTAVEEARFVQFFKDAYAYAESGKNGYSKLDAVVFVGDLSNTGSKKTMQKVKDALDANIKEGTTPICMLGNHEFMTQGKTTIDRFEKVFGTKANDHLVINGFHFIYLASNAESEGYHYDSEMVSWLETELAAAAKADPDKPIFVFQHVPIKDTVSGTWYCGQDDITAVLAKYPQVIDFSGHTHYPITYPKSIYQKDFTAVATGSFSYFAMWPEEVYGDLVFPTDEEGGYIDQRAYRDGNSYWMVEVDENGNTMLYGYDADTNTLACTYSVPFTTDKSKFTYTDARFNNPKTPSFSSSAKVEAYQVGVSGFELHFSQAECEDLVEYYKAEVYDGGKLLKTEYVLSCYYYTPMPETLSYCCDELEANHEYEVKIYPVTFLKKQGTSCLSIKVKTKADTAVTDADIFDLQFTSDGKAYNAATGEHLKVYGNPVVAKNSTLGKTTAKFDGESAYILYKFNDYYKDIKKSFTFELSFKADELGSFMNPCSNCEGGGVGYGFDKTGMLKIWVSLNGEYHILELGKVNTTDFVHAVTTFDGETIVCYVNGVEVSRDDNAHGTLSGTGNPTSENLVVAGDAADTNVYEAPFKGEVYAARVFSSVYTASQVNELYKTTMGK